MLFIVTVENVAIDPRLRDISCLSTLFDRIKAGQYLRHVNPGYGYSYDRELDHVESVSKFQLLLPPYPPINF